MERKIAATAFFMLFSIACFLSRPSLITASSSNITALFAFGDSTIDPGNNNHIATLCRGNHPPYGRDFPNHVSSGRFTNGKLSTDYLVSQLGLKDLLPAYLDPKLIDKDLLTGVSFASAGTGLDSLTADMAKVLKISTQLKNFDQALERIKGLVGEGKAKSIVENALFLISVGTNDMLDNFYVLPTRAHEYSVSGYHDFLLQKLESVIQTLYNAGGRRFIVAGLPPMGCLPLQVTLGSILPSQHMLQRVCVMRQNRDCRSYNKKLHVLISRLQSKELKGAKVAYLDIYNPIMDMIKYPAKYGFEQTLRGCCGVGLTEMGPLCNVADPICPDASKYIFWDAVHPTQATYSIIAKLAGQSVLSHILG